MAATTKIIVDFPATSAGWLAADLLDAERSVVLRPNRGDVYIEQGPGRNRVRNRNIKLANVLRFAATEISLGHPLASEQDSFHQRVSAVQISLLHSVSGPDKVWLLDLGTTATPLVAKLLLRKTPSTDIEAFCSELAQRAYAWVSQANAAVQQWREAHLADALSHGLPANFSALRSTINDVSGAATAASAASPSQEVIGHLDRIHVAVDKEMVVLNRLQQDVADVLRRVSPAAIDLGIRPMLLARSGDVPRPSKILVVDDDEGTRKWLTKMLSKHDFTVHSAACISDAVAIVREKPLDLVLLDLGLPDSIHGSVRPMGGFDVIAAIHKHQRDRSVRIVIITGQAFGEVRDAVESRGLEIVTKPFDQTIIDKIIPHE